MFSSVQGVHSIGKRAHTTLWPGSRRCCDTWASRAAQACLSIVEGAVRPRIARRHSGKGTASQAAKKLCFGTYLGREMSLLVPLNRYLLSFRTALAVRN